MEGSRIGQEASIIRSGPPARGRAEIKPETAGHSPAIANEFACGRPGQGTADEDKVNQVGHATPSDWRTHNNDAPEHTELRNVKAGIFEIMLVPWSSKIAALQKIGAEEHALAGDPAGKQRSEEPCQPPAASRQSAREGGWRQEERPQG